MPLIPLCRITVIADSTKDAPWNAFELTHLRKSTILLIPCANALVSLLIHRTQTTISEEFLTGCNRARVQGWHERFRNALHLGRTRSRYQLPKPLLHRTIARQL